MTRANRKIFKWTIVILVVIIVSNIPIVSLFIGFFTQTKFFDESNYDYSSGSGKFQTNELHLKGEDPNARNRDLIKQFNPYKKGHPNDTILYRNFKINVLKFWFWREYIHDNRFHLPYKELPKEESTKTN